MTIRIPTSSENTQKDFENIGIQIKETIKNEKGKEFYEIILPENWNVVELYPNSRYAIIDENNNQRVEFFYDANKPYLGANSTIKTRYSIHIIDITKRDPRDYYYNEVYFYDNKESEIIFSLTKGDIETMKKEMLEWINSNYPDWQDFNAYWNKSNKLQQ